MVVSIIPHKQQVTFSEAIVPGAKFSFHYCAYGGTVDYRNLPEDIAQAVSYLIENYEIWETVNIFDISTHSLKVTPSQRACTYSGLSKILKKVLEIISKFYSPEDVTINGVAMKDFNLEMFIEELEEEEREYRETHDMYEDW